MPMLNNISDFFLGENSNFCDLKKIALFDFESNFEKKIPYVLS